MSYRAGELRERVTFRRKSEETDEYGTVSETLSDIATVWAHVRPMSGRERTQAQQLEANANYLVVVRNRDELTEADVVVWRGDTMNIRFIKDRGPRSLYLEIEAERGVAI